MTRNTRALVTAIAALLLAPLAQAGVIGTTGDANLIGAPAAATKNAAGLSNSAGGSDSYVWFESAGALASDQTVDTDAAGTLLSDPGNVVISAGTYVESYMLYFDVLGNSQGASNGSITFSSDVLGIMGNASLLRTSHGSLGNAGTSYITGSNSFQGIWDSNGDSVTLSADLRTVSFNFTVGTAIDTIRILTAETVPTPAPLALLLVGALALLRRR